MRKIAITDMHGCAKTFRKLVEEEVKLTLDDQLFLLGDYIDRGPDSKGVVDYIFTLMKRGHTVQCLKGNHEQLMLNSENPRQAEETAHWLKNGGDATLDSFGAKVLSEVPRRYLDFFKSLHYYLEVDEFLVVHAGFNFRCNDPFSDTNAMIWIRNFPIDKAVLGDRIIVHGHTPTYLHVIKENIADKNSQVLNIDNGCVYHPYNGLGHLCALDMTNRKLYTLEYCE